MTAAERALGVAIRKGQDAGEIARRGQGGGTEYSPNATRPRPDKTMSLPSEFVRHGQERDDIYVMTDNVSIDQFDAAVAEAKEEGNLSRPEAGCLMSTPAAHKVVTVERQGGYASRCDTCGDITFGGFATRTEARDALRHDVSPTAEEQ